MLTISAPAQAHFMHILQQQGIADLGIRLSALNPGTAKADCRLEFCEPADLLGDEWSVECQGFTLFVAADSTRWLDGAELDLEQAAGGERLRIKAPQLKGQVPGAEASVIERVRYLLETEISPMLASHGGRVTLEEIDADGRVTLRFGGGCHGCGMVDVTLREGIEKTLKAKIPEITGVRDATDHASGSAPYLKR
ncbi:MAG: Fe-S biogenesis protein NfuA [Lysobacterales bacterium CG02_land_8_20_14_3_00_62_12]|nr:MAG: Fe-S biogenesis protein NfuA [Xanthomonadales bacterium CG02_land_8_20_14_3_00_62_12]